MSTTKVMKAWQYTSPHGPLEKTLHLNSSAPIPKPTPSQFLVQIIATALNPIDYKPAETPLLSRLAIRKPATPGLDFAGYIVTSPSNSASTSNLHKGQLVFGVVGTSPMAGGGLAEYAISQDTQLVALPEGIDPVDAATIGVAGLTAYQTIIPHVKSGDRVFINGGSGGTGVFGIQIAKAAGCHVTTTCSGRNVELCRALGADEVIDYSKGNVVEALIASTNGKSESAAGESSGGTGRGATGQKYNHVVDNIGHDQTLYWRCHEYTDPKAMYIFVGAELSLASIVNSLKRKVWPAGFGGAKRKSSGFFAQAKKSDLEQIAAWMKEGKVKAVIDQKFPFDEAPRAIEKLKTGRARGKIVVEVSKGPFEEESVVS